MFVPLKKTLKTTAIMAAIGLTSAACASAADSATERDVLKKDGGTIPVTIALENVQTAAGPIYISIQKEDHYMGMKGFGGVIKTAVQGNMTETFNVDTPGEYAVSIWHDLNDNTVFDMGDNYIPQEGYGSSGNAPTDRPPKFEDVKVAVPYAGLGVTIDMKYPN